MEIDLKTVLGSYAQITIFLLMLSIGLGEGFNNLSTLWQRPSLLTRALIAAFGVVPLAAIVVLWVFPLDPDTRVALAAMAICPGAPLTYKKLTGMKANTALASSYQTTTSLFAVLGVPLWVLIFNVLYPRQAEVSAMVVLQQVAFVQFMPILLGAAMAEWLATLAENLLGLVSKIATFMFLGLVVLLLVVALPLILKVGVIPILAVVVFVAIAILAGHYLGGPDPETRLTLGLANSTRNAGLALALATANFDQQPGILAAISAIALLAFVADAIYAAIYRKHHPEIVHP